MLEAFEARLAIGTGLVIGFLLIPGVIGFLYLFGVLP